MTTNKQLIFYTTAGCHLCEQAEGLLMQVLPKDAVEIIDIAESDELIARYGERIPVLALGERELGWPFGLLDIQALLEA